MLPHFAAILAPWEEYFPVRIRSQRGLHHTLYGPRRNQHGLHHNLYIPRRNQ